MQLRLAGLSWRGLARDLCVSPQAVQQTAAGRPSVPIERALAARLGLSPQQLFPEHWTSAGVRIPVERASLHKAQHSDIAKVRHGKNHEAA